MRIRMLASGYELWAKEKEWLKIMHEEKKFLYENHVFEMVELPKDKRELKNK